MEPGEIDIEEVLQKWQKHHPPPERGTNNETPWYQQPVSEYSNNQRRRRRMLKKSTADFVNNAHHIQNRFRVVPPVIDINVQLYKISQCCKCSNLLQYFPVQTNETAGSQTLSLFEYAVAKKHLQWFGLNFFQRNLLNACYESKDRKLLKELVLKGNPVLFVHNVCGTFNLILLHLFCTLSGKLPYSVINENSNISPFLKYCMEKIGFVFLPEGSDNTSKVDLVMNLLKSNHHVFVQLNESELSSSITGRFFPSLLNSLRSSSDLLKRVLLVPVSLSIETSTELFSQSFSILNLLKDYVFNSALQQELSVSYFNVSQSVRLQSLFSVAAELNEQDGTDEENNLVMRHISFDLLESGAILPTHLVSFLLMTKYRESVHIDVLVESVEWLIGEMQSSDRFIGFIGDTVTITNHALRILSSDGVIRLDNDTKIVSIDVENCNSMQVIFNNAKKIINVFLPRSVLAKSIVACLGGWLELATGSGYNVTCKNTDLLEKAEYLAEMLSFLFDFCCPFNKITENLVDALEKLTTMDILCTSSETYESQTHQKLVRSVAVDSVFDQYDEDEDMYGSMATGDSITYNVNLQEKSVLELLNFFSSCTTPFVDIIFLVVALIRETETEVVITVDKIYESVCERLQNGFFMYGEMLTKNFISRIFDFLYEKEVLDEYKEGFHLSNYYLDGDGEMEKFLLEIASFR